MKQAIQIQIYDGNKLLVQETFDQSKIVIGRILSADLRVPDTRISRIHALLERTDEGKLRLTDLASSHGTTVNGQKIIEKTVGPADQIELAGLKLQIQFVRVEDSVSDEVVLEKTERIQAPQERPASKNVSPQREVAIDMGGASPQVKTSRDPTAIRSLKETARSRGALESQGSINEVLEFTVYWEETVLNIEHIRGFNRVVKIGEGDHNDYVVPSHVLPPSHEFLKVRGSKAEIFLHPSMKGSVRLNGEMQTVDALQKAGRNSVQIQGSDIAKIEVGTVNFFLMFVSNPPPVPRDQAFDQGGLFWTILMLVSILTGGLMFVASHFERPIEGTVKEFPERVRKIIVQAYKHQVAPPIVGEKAQQGQHVEGATKIGEKAQQAKGEPGEGSRAKGPEGKSGRPDEPRLTGGVNNVPNKHPDNKRARPVRLNIKEDPKTLLESLKASGIGNRIAKGGAYTGSSLDQAFKGIGGNSGNSQGNGGLGLQGTGKGGGSKVEGVGGLGSKGFGLGDKGTGNGAVFGKGEASVGTESLNIIVLGGLSREEIMRVVEAHKSEVLLCYQRAVQMEPGLAGKLELFWQITEGGRVQAIKVQKNTTGSASLSDCVAGRLRSWKFPSPPPGSTVDVTWPWAMKPTGR